MSIDPKEFGKMVGHIESLLEQMKELNKKVEENSKSIERQNTWLKMLGFLATIVVPSVWALIWANILNKEALSALLGLAENLPFM